MNFCPFCPIVSCILCEFQVTCELNKNYFSENTSNKKVKKKKKKKSAAIVSIDDFEDVDSSREDLPTSDSTDFQPSQSQLKKTAKPGHSRSSSYPGKIKVEFPDTGMSNTPNSHGFSREMSLSDDSIAKWTDTNSEELNYIVYPELNKTIYTQSVETIEEKDEKHVEIVMDHKNNKDSLLISKDSSKQENFNEVSGSTVHNIPQIKSEKESSLFSFKSFKSKKTKTIVDEESIDVSGPSEEDMLSSSVSKESDILVVMGGEDGLLPLTQSKLEERTDIENTLEESERHDGEEEKNSSKDSVSLSRLE